MKIIVVSDTHGNSSSLERVMELHSDADAVVHCGDSRGEMAAIKMRYRGVEYYEVQGNCDLGSPLPLMLTFKMDGFKFMVTHGHAYGVKYGLGRLFEAAKEEGADVVFYGHTHIPDEAVYDGVRMLCPGACGGWGATFAIAETNNGQILTNIVQVRKLK